MSLSAGERLGPYEILSPLGAGGMGEVYRARDTKLDREVAIKVLPAALAHDAERLARFEREAKVLASLNHPNIAQIYGVEESLGVRALVMELVPGAPLHTPISLDTSLHYSRQIADALEAAHDKGIIHRDLKPANIMVTPEGAVKVLDFGLAAVAQPSSSSSTPENSPTITMAATQMGVIMGTAAYMSPEQAAGKPVDRRADIWSFGVVLWEMLTGARLFDGETVSHTLADVLRAPIDFEKLPADTPRVIRELVRRCLDRDVKTRLRDIGEARVTLQNPDREGGDITLAPASSRSQISRAWASAAALLAVGFVVASVSWYRASRPVDHPLSRLSVDLGPDAVAIGGITVAISPDGTRLVYPVKSNDGKQQLATRLLDQTAATQLPGTEDGRDPFFSPDGQWVGFFAESKLKKISVAGGAPVTLCDAPNGRGASWGEDGNIVAALTTNSVGLTRIPAAGGSSSKITIAAGAGGITHRWPQVLPGNEGILFTASNNLVDFRFATIEAISLRSGQRKTVVRDAYFGRYFSVGPAGYLVYIHEGVLLAAPFDPAKLELRGTPQPVVEELEGDPYAGTGKFDFSRTGTFVYHSGKAVMQNFPVKWLDNLSRISTLLAAPAFYLTPRFSPSGERLALSVILNRGRDIFVYDWRREAMLRLTSVAQSNRIPSYPVWAPDGKHIAYRSAPSSGGSSIEWLRSDGSGEDQRLFESKGTVVPYSFSPDGGLLAYYEQATQTGWDLWTLPLDLADADHPKSGKPALFLGTPANERHPFFSPSGHWIAYESDESGQSEIYIRPYPPSRGRWQISTGGGMSPMWSQTGRELFYVSPDSHIEVVDYTADANSFMPGKARVWSSEQIREQDTNPTLDLHPDGKRFAVFPRAESPEADEGSTHVTFLLNFFDEVRRKVAVGK